MATGRHRKENRIIGHVHPTWVDSTANSSRNNGQYLHRRKVTNSIRIRTGDRLSGTPPTGK
ncbi:hypothetical protein SARC_09262 [Sphaeroforma arctica JP610]|uniref:Uncharacterized protein n=1 Tax=Sphaeroforma arctica JP610 TaxID=667725 RepID=A0A0L0FNK3_9EUKA|nr:hypothetical protein SARC_09262 [Sphaeroforma arctica JP610]KNC78299.1 hypothetical protein SARC_09262 [Sphaeroforma arctica JP610]|eukprot:XP_014152201.1 hypothetical protein SARC_09262 [Sphaeroforma arctica JP610]